ncbi:pre-mRNA-splicing factor CWC25 homolog [Terrapene carolina triunguis]|uniref:pre-mRNA-splicing factor CWC25 homolog n=1 Tax=Terrapene triunguis TaxID=2587831 RepID=UPI000E774360|nr:pre-mRNA-splicing factor CWC25 homolog [Terrapene carolina triunguis]
MDSSWEPVHPKVPGYGLQSRDPDHSHRPRRSPAAGQERATHKHRDRARSRSRSGSPKRDTGKKSTEEEESEHRYSTKVDRKEKERARSPSPKKGYRRQHASGYTRKLSAEELERKRQEMLENAKWREEERANNVRRHRKEEERERELEKLSSRDGKFLHHIKLESASTSSVEDRVKRNIHSIQRTPAALEKNFMQR